MTEQKLIIKTEVACEELLYFLQKIDSISEDGKLELQGKLKQVSTEIRFKKTDWGDL